MLFEDNDFDVNLSLFVNDVDFKNNNILNPNEGFLRGNMFRNEYIPYKNLSYFKLEPKNEEERLLNQIMALTFAINDFNLYLDLHPNNDEVFNLFKKYLKEKEKLTQEYAKIYGSLDLDEASGYQYDWLNNWPWNSSGGSIYV